MNLSAEQPIRILVVDDHPIVRDGLVAILETQPDFVVVGTAATGREGAALAAARRPQVVLLDLEMPDLDGPATLRLMRQHRPDIRALIFTAFDSDERIVSAVEAGAQGYLLKGAPREEIFNAIRIVARGGSLLQPVVASRLLRRLSTADEGPKDVASLTPREREVLALLARGLPNKAIAAELVISERTVKFHVSALLGKLGASNRTEAVRLAAQRGLIDLT